mmetsp:Transcript_4569/g.16631  ORF Transcript_4569/g.16631 Transcript_4569/m.16631 type:complete len:261 (+) Transcript_4569:3217-3999(+)
MRQVRGCFTHVASSADATSSMSSTASSRARCAGVNDELPHTHITKVAYATSASSMPSGTGSPANTSSKAHRATENTRSECSVNCNGGTPSVMGADNTPDTLSATDARMSRMSHASAIMPRTGPVDATTEDTDIPPKRLRPRCRPTASTSHSEASTTVRERFGGSSSNVNGFHSVESKPWSEIPTGAQQAGASLPSANPPGSRRPAPLASLRGLTTAEPESSVMMLAPPAAPPPDADASAEPACPARAEDGVGARPAPPPE